MDIMICPVIFSLYTSFVSLNINSLYTQGDVVLPLPSIEVLAEVAGSQARTGIVVHVLESFVVTWMKLIKVCM